MIAIYNSKVYFQDYSLPIQSIDHSQRGVELTEEEKSMVLKMSAAFEMRFTKKTKGQCSVDYSHNSPGASHWSIGQMQTSEDSKYMVFGFSS